MKKILVAVAVVALLTSCGLSQSSTTSNAGTQQAAARTTAVSSAQTAGQSAGTALQALRAQYVLDGKYDYKNMQNVLNTVTLLANCEGLKTNYKDKAYLADFGKGLIAGSLGLISQNNVQTVTNSLVNMVTSSAAAQNAQTKAAETATKAAGYADTAASYANTAAQYAGALGSILSAFGAK